MKYINNLSRTLLIVGLSLGVSLARADVVTIDFEMDSDSNSLVNGLAITEAPALSLIHI